VSAAPGTEFPNLCTVCGADDDHAEWRAQSEGYSGWTFGATHCPHPANPGHGTGCCCAGRSRPIFAFGTAADAKTNAPRRAQVTADLTQRVAALEDIVRQAAAQMGIPADVPMTDEQTAEFRRLFDEAMKGPFTYRVLPPPPPLTPAEIRQLLRESVTVVKPGEVLFYMYGDPNGTPNQIRELQDWINWWLEDNAPDIRVLCLPHGEMAAAESGPD
jgi:hypothetical protein